MDVSVSHLVHDRGRPLDQAITLGVDRLYIHGAIEHEHVLSRVVHEILA